MNMNQLTQKSLAAIQGAQRLAQQYGQQQIEQQHLLLALVADQEGFIPQLRTAMGMTVPSFLAGMSLGTILLMSGTLSCHSCTRRKRKSFASQLAQR